MSDNFSNTIRDKKFNEIINESLALMLKFVIPLYIKKNNRPCLLGSGFFVRAKEEFFLVSAAHVMDEVDNQSIFFYVNNNQIRYLSGTLRRSRIIDKRQNDKIDVAVLHMTGDVMPPYPDVDKFPMDISYLVPQDLPREDKTYAIVGFPASKSKTNPIKKSIFVKPYAYYNPSIIHDEYINHEASPQSHVILNFNQKGFDENGQPITFPKPQGMSGSPIWQLYDENQNTNQRVFPVVGVGIEYRKRKQVIVGTDVQFVLDMINDVIGA